MMIVGYPHFRKPPYDAHMFLKILDSFSSKTTAMSDLLQGCAEAVTLKIFMRRSVPSKFKVQKALATQKWLMAQND